MFNIGILIFEDVEELDFVGPYEVFTMVNEVMQAMKKPDAVSVKLVGVTDGTIRCAKGMRVMTDTHMDAGEKWDLILVPGGAGTRPLLENQPVLNWIADQNKTTIWTTSVCTGSMLLVKSGVAKGKNITTHHFNYAEFEKRGLEAKINKDERYVRDGKIVTSAGISAGMDMALWLVGQIFNEKMARHVQAAMQYFPQPPYRVSGETE